MERLKSIDEVSLLEVLDISSEDIIDRFADRIEERYDTLKDDFDKDEETEESD